MIDEKRLLDEIAVKISPEQFGEHCNAADVIQAFLQLIDEQPRIKSSLVAGLPSCCAVCPLECEMNGCHYCKPANRRYRKREEKIPSWCPMRNQTMGGTGNE